MTIRIDDAAPDVINRPGVGNIFGSGSSVPANGALGWAHGAIFLNTSGANDADAMYVNNGTSLSASFSNSTSAPIVTTDQITNRTQSSPVSIVPDGTLAARMDSTLIELALPVYAGPVSSIERAQVSGIYTSGTIAVTVPSIANDVAENVDSVDVSLAAMTFVPAVGDAVIAVPLAALPTDCLLLGAYISATDTATVTFGSKEAGGGVTGAAVNFKFIIFDLT